MALQEELKEQSRQLNEYKEIYDRQQRERLLQEQRDPRGSGHFRDNMDHWHTHHDHQATLHQDDLTRYENVCHDIPAVGVPGADPQPSLQPDPWLRPPFSGQIPRTQPPYYLPAKESSVANLKSLESFITNDQNDWVEVESSESRYRSSWLGVIEVDKLSAANQETYRPILRHAYGEFYYDPDHIMVPRTDPRAIALSRHSPPPRPQPPVILPTRKPQITPIDDPVPPDNAQQGSRAVEAYWADVCRQAVMRNEMERRPRNPFDNEPPTQAIVETVQDYTHPCLLWDKAPASMRESDLIQYVRKTGDPPRTSKCRREGVFNKYYAKYYGWGGGEKNGRGEKKWLWGKKMKKRRRKKGKKEGKGKGKGGKKEGKGGKLMKNGEKTSFLIFFPQKPLNFHIFSPK